MPPRPAANTLIRDTSHLVASIPLSTITPTPGLSVAQENLTTLTSYDLLSAEKRTILVPGCPPIWTPPTLPATVPQDSGSYSSDPVRDIFPHCPLEPFFRALPITSPSFPLHTVDLITDRRNLRLLLSLVSDDPKAFRIDVEVISKTVCFFCWHESPVDVVCRFRGYGREFEKVFTKSAKEARDSVSHNRAVSYTLGGLKLVVRFKVEGYIPGLFGGGGPRYKGPSYKEMKLKNPKQTQTGYAVVVKGHFVPMGQLLEIKTARMGREVRERSMDQMWFSRTRMLCEGYWEEKEGFTRVVETDVVKEGLLEEWEKRNEEKLRKLVKVLETVAEVVKRKKGRYVLVHEEGSKVLQILGVKEGYKGGIPDDVVQGWGKL